MLSCVLPSYFLLAVFFFEVFLALDLELAAFSPPHEVFFLETAFLLAALRSLSAFLLALTSLLSFLSDSDLRCFSSSFLPSSVRP